MKITFLAGTLGNGGAERQLFYMLQALCHAGLTPRLLCLEQGGFWEEPIERLGVPVTWVGRHPSRVKRVVRIVQELRRDPPDILQSAHFFANGYAAAAARLLGFYEIGALRSNGLAEVRDGGPVGGWFNLHTPRILAANSRPAIAYAKSAGVASHRLYLLPNVVDTARLRPTGWRRENAVCLLAVGRLVPPKRFDRFISVVARARKELGGGVRGMLVGDGPLRAELERQAAERGLSPALLEFKGAVAGVASIYPQGDIFLSTSDYEGTPNAVLEAMASGLPVVATKVGGVPDLIRSGETGWLTEPDDEEGLVAAVVQLVRAPELRMSLSKRARAYVEDRHSLHRLPAHLTGLYRLALPKRWRVEGALADGATL